MIREYFGIPFSFFYQAFDIVNLEYICKLFIIHPSHHLFFTSCVVECIGLIGNQNEKQKEQKENISQQICIQKPFPVQG